MVDSPENDLGWVDILVSAFEAAWRRGEHPRIEDFVQNVAGARRTVLLNELVQTELQLRAGLGDEVDHREFLEEHFALAAELRALLPSPVALQEDLSTPPASVAETHDWPAAGRDGVPPGGPTHVEIIRQLGDFRLEEQIGKGGMGVVYKAQQLSLNRTVAVKLLLPGVIRSSDDVQRFRVEAQAAGRLSHPNIVAVYQFGESDGQHYFAMAYVEGEDLARRLRAGLPRPRQAAIWIHKVARAIHYAHCQGVIHRDLTPKNILLDASGEPQITDFGLAKVTDADLELTQTGQILGTPSYMSPEQAAGQTERIGPATDIYALGAILYQVLTGQPPFSGSMGEVLVKVQREEPTALRKLVPQIHRDIETICIKAMAKSPEERYGSAAELAEDLERFSTGDAILARRRGLLARSVRAVARRPMFSAVMAAAVLVMILGGILAMRGQRERRTASLVASLDADFRAGDWSAVRLERMNNMIEQLRHLSPEQAALEQRQLAQWFTAWIKEQINLPHLESEKQAQLEASLNLLANHVPDQVAALRKDFQRRLHTLESVFELQAPFASLEDVFNPAEVKVEGSALVRVSDASSKPSFTILTRKSSGGVVVFEVELDASWDRAQQVGIGLGATVDKPDAVVAGGTQQKAQPTTPEVRGYQFLLRNLPLGPSAGDTGRRGDSFAESRRSGGQISIEILHDATQLRKVRVDASRLHPGPLRLTASKDREELKFNVGDLEQVTFLDAFGSSGTAGVFSLEWPAETRILKLRAQRQASSEKPSPLEQGDSLYASGLYAQAQAAYEEQAGTHVPAEIGQEIRYKKALCLLKRNRGKEAEPLFEGLASESDSQWAALAACGLWLQLVRQNRFDQRTEAIFDSLKTQYDFQKLVNFVPEQLHSEIVRGYSSQAMGMNFYKPNPDLIAQCERAIAITKLFHSETDLLDQFDVQSLLRAYRSAGKEDQALRTAERLLVGVDDRNREHAFFLVEIEYLWLLRISPQPERALDEVNRLIAAGATADDWIMERVRSLYALGRTAEAEKALDAWFANKQAKDSQWVWCAACAMRGFLRDRREDHAGAIQAWKDGAKLPWVTFGRGFPTLYGLIDASLADAVTESDAQKLLEAAQAQAGPVLSLLGTSSFEQLLPLKTAANVLRDSFRSPRGRELAENIAFRSAPYALCIEAPPQLLLYEMVRQGSLANPPTREQDELLWQTVAEGYKAVMSTRKLSKNQVLQLLLTWKGMTGSLGLGWSGVAPVLEPTLRGKIAYFVGHRYLRRGQRDDAAMFFRTAWKDAPSGSPLQTLAAKELERLATPHAQSK